MVQASSKRSSSGEGVVPGESARACFPYFQRPQAHYLDSAASAQKPSVVIERLSRYLAHEHANIHRGAYQLSAHATELYDSARETVARFVGCEAREVVFTKGATESINLVSHAFGNSVPRGSNILITLLEHHSNIVPWQLLAARQGLNLHFVDVTPEASLNMSNFEEQIARLKPALVACTMVSNAFGTVVDTKRVVQLAHTVGAKVLLDASQAVVHEPINFTATGADFMVFSGHKLYGPTGIGVLCARYSILEQMEPYQGGGDMIQTVSVAGSTWADAPQRFEAGTPPIAEAIGLATAIDFLTQIGMQAVAAHEKALFRAAFEMLRSEPDVVVYGPATAGREQSSIIPFTVGAIHPHDIATVLDSVGVQVRAGHHCAMPALRALGIHATARMSFGVYSTERDIEALQVGIRTVRRVFSA